MVRAEGRLELRLRYRGAPGPVYVDLVRPGLRHLRHPSGLLKQPIARAIGARGERPAIVDATAGLGRDALLLACLGCQVTAVERSPVLAAMLRDGLERAIRDPKLGPILTERLRLIEGDAREFLSSLSEGATPDVVYLDPMFALKKKSALVKKEMRVLRRLVGDDPDAAELLEAARRTARRRVVVKRLLHAPALAPNPDISYRGKIARYDVYLGTVRCER